MLARSRLFSYSGAGKMLKYIIAVTALALPLAAQAQQSDRIHDSGMPHVEHVEGVEYAKDTPLQEP